MVLPVNWLQFVKMTVYFRCALLVLRMTSRKCSLIIIISILLVAGFIKIMFNFRNTLPRQFLSMANPNSHDFNLVINEPTKCTNRNIFLLVLVHSVQMNFESRKLIRETWGSVTDVGDKHIVTMFLLAKTINPIYQPQVEEESRMYKDLLMEDFIDSYQNLTLKTIMGMKWAGGFCGHATYVMKTDDDMFVGYDSIVTHLSQSAIPRTNFMTGLVINSTPNRDPESKWYIPWDMYRANFYPPFCSGSGYVLSGDMPQRIYTTSLLTPYLPLEDVYLAICVNKLNVSPVRHREFNNGAVAYNYCRYKVIFTTHLKDMPKTEKYRIWADLKSSAVRQCALYNFLHFFRII